MLRGRGAGRSCPRTSARGSVDRRAGILLVGASHVASRPVLYHQSLAYNEPKAARRTASTCAGVSAAVTRERCGTCYGGGSRVRAPGVGWRRAVGGGRRAGAVERGAHVHASSAAAASGMRAAAAGCMRMSRDSRWEARGKAALTSVTVILLEAPVRLWRGCGWLAGTRVCSHRQSIDSSPRSLSRSSRPRPQHPPSEYSHEHAHDRQTADSRHTGGNRDCTDPHRST